jgi:hypothetical protein
MLSPPVRVEWDELNYGSRCCLGEMTGFRATFVEETLAKQQATEIEKWVKCMLYWCVHDRSKGKIELHFTESEGQQVYRGPSD